MIAIDPGTTQSAYVQWDGLKIESKGILTNEYMLEYLTAWKYPSMYSFVRIP